MASDVEKGVGTSRRRHALQLLLPFLGAALLAFLLATAAFGITHHGEDLYLGDDGGALWPCGLVLLRHTLRAGGCGAYACVARSRMLGTFPLCL